MIFDFSSVDYNQDANEKVCLGNMQQFKNLVDKVFNAILNLYDDYEFKYGDRKIPIRDLLIHYDMIYNYELYRKIIYHINYSRKMLITKKFYNNDYTNFDITSATFRNVDSHFYSLNFTRLKNMLNVLALRTKNKKIKLCFL